MSGSITGLRSRSSLVIRHSSNAQFIGPLTRTGLVLPSGVLIVTSSLRDVESVSLDPRGHSYAYNLRDTGRWLSFGDARSLVRIRRIGIANFVVRHRFSMNERGAAEGDCKGNNVTDTEQRRDLDASVRSENLHPVDSVIRLTFASGPQLANVPNGPKTKAKRPARKVKRENENSMIGH